MSKLDRAYEAALSAASRARGPVLDVENPEDIDSVVRREMPDIVRRARKAGARGPLTYIGAGMTGVVLQSPEPSGGRCWKVGRRPSAHLRDMLADEAEWLSVARGTKGVRQYVVRVRRYHPGPIVIERDCVDGKRGGWSDESKLHDLHRQIEKLMLPRGWTSPEFKGDSYIITSKGPVLVDGGMAQRVGKALLAYVAGVLAGTTKLRHGDRLADLAFYIRREVNETITPEQAAPLLARLPHP